MRESTSSQPPPQSRSSYFASSSRRSPIFATRLVLQQSPNQAKIRTETLQRVYTLTRDQAGNLTQWSIIRSCKMVSERRLNGAYPFMDSFWSKG